MPRLLDRQTPVHFIGVGGIGMSALARILVDRGHSVSGSDPRDNATTQQLKTLGVKVFRQQDATCIDAVTEATVAGSPVVVISTAIPEAIRNCSGPVSRGWRSGIAPISWRL